MTTESGTYLYNPFISELFDEAVENAGINPSATGGAHIKSMQRSLRLMLNSEWATIGIRNWMVTQESHTTAVGETTFTLPAGGMDIVEAVLRRPGSGIATYSDVEMYAITRNEYLTLVSKQNQGRPDRYWVERLADTKVVHYWQAGSNTTDQIVYNMFQQNQDVTSSLQLNLGLPVYAYAALAAGLAARLALKWNPQKYELLQTIYAGPQWSQNPLNPGGLLAMLITEDRERGDIDTYPAFEPRVGRR
ncbi:MAG TPA: hypothetical protein VLH80_07430 [Nitrospiraceae bacterium]|nr:hypothetical protein [Nitrospiraceae bacterium]